MPTGYTQMILDGKVKTPKEFLHLCLRNFGVCICMRDDSFDVDMDYWCLLKHSIVVYQFSKEVRDTNRNNEMYEELFLQASEYMYKILSLFLGTDIVKCWRCLLDAMEEKEDGKLSTEN